MNSEPNQEKAKDLVESKQEKTKKRISNMVVRSKQGCENTDARTIY